MEGELFERIYRVLVVLGKRPRRCVYSDAWILAVYLWAVLHDRPVCWACNPANWPAAWRDRPLPSASRISERLRTGSVRQLLKDVEQCLAAAWLLGWCKWIDGLPLPVGGCTRDRQARYGPGAGLMAKGYKFHALVDAGGRVVAWRVAPLNVNEKKMAQRMLRDLPRMDGYLVADAEYDANAMYRWAESRGLQLVATPIAGAGQGHRWQSPARRRGLRLQAGPFGQDLCKQRYGIDRFFGQLTSCAVGLKPLPAWVRGLHRVRLWVQAKLICVYAWRHQHTRLTA